MKLVIALALLVLSVNAGAGDLRDIKRSCGERASLHAGIHWLEQCIEDVVTLRPVHPAIHSIAPGTGVALGAGFDVIQRVNRTEILPSAVLVRSTDGSTFAQAGITFAVPPWTFARITEDNTQVIDPEDQGFNDSRSSVRPKDSGQITRVALVRDYWQIDSKLSIAFNVHWMDARRQDFFGLGPVTSQAGLAFFGLRTTGAEFTIDDPITTWSEAGFELEFIHPEVRSVLNASRPSIGQIYSNTTAPGLTSNPDTARFEPYIRFRLPLKNYHFRQTEFKVGYAFYHDVDNSRFSFRRLHADVRSEQDIRIPSMHTASHRTKLANFLCSELRSRKHCSAGTITVVGSVSASYTGSNSAVPFYLDETLGGADIYGNDTLRGFVDNRFRAPNRMLFQAEYRHRLWGPVGFLSFADAGRVALTPSDLAFEHMRHDYGIGLFVSATNRILLRAYVGFGTREGIRPNAKFPSAFQ